MPHKSKHERLDANHLAAEAGGVPIDGEWEPQNFKTELAVKGEQNDKANTRRRLLCFECNRSEGHFLSSQHRWFYSFLVGITFGAIFLFGPYQCQCCGARRLMINDSLSLKYWIRTLRHRGVPRKRSNRRI